MRSIIALMSDIEKEAGEIVDIASAKKVKLYEEFEDKMKQIDEKYNKKLQIELEKLNDKCMDTYKKETKKVCLSTESKIEELEMMYKSKHDKHIDILFNRIIGM